MITAGMSLELKHVVTSEHTASKMASGALEVFGTPTLIAFMEECSLQCVKPELEEGQSTVGTMINMKHLAATPVGMEVRVVSTLTEVDRKRLMFDIKAYDEAGLIGECTHERFIVDSNKFMEKTNAKLGK